MSESPEASHVLAAVHRLPDPERWRRALVDNRPDLARWGARHLVVYRGLDDPQRIFVTVGIHHREPLTEVLRSGVVMQWFDSAGVEDIPPLFAGDVVEKIQVAGPPSPGGHPGVVVAAVAPVGDVDGLVRRIHEDRDEFRRAGVTKVWVYRALDDGHEVMILQEVDTEEHARRWLRHPEVLGEWMRGAGVGVYPPVFVGTLADIVEPERDR